CHHETRRLLAPGAEARRVANHGRDLQARRHVSLHHRECRSGRAVCARRWINARRGGASRARESRALSRADAQVSIRCMITINTELTEPTEKRFALWPLWSLCCRF